MRLELFPHSDAPILTPDPSWQLCDGVSASSPRGQRLWLAIHAARVAFLEYQLRLMADHDTGVNCAKSPMSAAALVGLDAATPTWFFRVIGGAGLVFLDPRFGRVFTNDSHWLSTRQLTALDRQLGTQLAGSAVGWYLDPCWASVERVALVSYVGRCLGGRERGPFRDRIHWDADLVLLFLGLGACVQVGGTVIIQTGAL